MPLKRCPNGWKWGDKGKCYTGKDAKKKAIKQGIAIEGPEKFKSKAENKVLVEEALWEMGYPLEQIRELMVDI